MSDERTLKRLRTLAWDIVMPEILVVLDNHQFLGDRCACGITLDTTPDEEEEEITDPGWVSWIIHVEQVTLKIEVNS